MKFSQKLFEGVFLKRYKRFFADIEFQGQQLVAHVPNTGSMKGLNQAGLSCLFSESANKERKLKFTLEMIKAPSGSWVGVNTATPNTIVKEVLVEAVKNKNCLFSTWHGFDEVKAEFKISPESRLDFALSKNGTDKKHFIEVKNVTLAEGTQAQFPDAVSERGQKHLRDLMRLMEDGHSAELVFVIQRQDCLDFAPADSIDPEYGRLLRLAVQNGLKVSPYKVSLSPEEVILLPENLILKL